MAMPCTSLRVSKLSRAHPCSIFFLELGRLCHEWVSAWRSFTEHRPSYGHQDGLLRRGPCTRLSTFSTHLVPTASMFRPSQNIIHLGWIHPKADFLSYVWRVFDRGRPFGWPQLVLCHSMFWTPIGCGLHLTQSIHPAYRLSLFYLLSSIGKTLPWKGVCLKTFH